jgi:hypothetical protein
VERSQGGTRLPADAFFCIAVEQIEEIQHPGRLERSCRAAASGRPYTIRNSQEPCAASLFESAITKHRDTETQRHRDSEEY